VSKDLEMTPTRAAVYRDLLARGEEAELSLAELIERHGLAVLDRDVPYLLVALRHQTASRLRRGRPRASSAETSPALLDGLDPARIVVANEELRAVVEALGRLEPRDAWALWWHADGLDDDEIASRWADAGFEPPDPSRDYLRKRRERARKVVRAEMADWRRARG
jgi:hypothetical protein